MRRIFRGPYDGPNARALRAWIEQHMPDLDAEMGSLDRLGVLRKLNQVTGLDIRAEEGIESSCPRFLAALQAQHTSGKEAA